MDNVSSEEGALLSTVFRACVESNPGRFFVALRQRRAAELRDLLADSQTIELETFNKEVWALESQTVLHPGGVSIKVTAKETAGDIPPEWLEALKAGRLELHGNYLWRPASGIFAPHSKDNQERLEGLQFAVLILNDSDMSPIDKARQLMDIKGLGENTATGLVMVFHPDSFAIRNQQSRAALARLGIQEDSLELFQGAVADLRQEVGAEDFLELDWFLYQVAQGNVDLGKKETATAWLFQANPKFYDLSDALLSMKVGDEDDWSVSRYRDEMQIGDPVVLWQGGRAAGIYAVGELIGPPFERPTGEFWPDKEQRGPTEWAIAFRYTHILEDPIPKAVLQAHPILNDLQVLRAPQGTNFKIASEQWTALQNLLHPIDNAVMPRVWIEKTIVHGRPDREQGDYALGKALWSPTRAKTGADVYRFMRDVQPGNVILHLTDNVGFTGISRAASAFEAFAGVPGTNWEGECYLIRLRDYVTLDPPLLRDVFFSPPYRERLVGLIDAGTRNLFYNREPNLNQGAYLTPAPTELVEILNDAYRATVGKDLPIDSSRDMTRQRRYWKIAPGEDGRLWERFQRQNRISVGWTGSPDLRSLHAETEQELRERIQVLPAMQEQRYRFHHAASQLWMFYNQMAPGDLVCAYGSGRVYGWGEITNDYRFDEGEADYPHYREVEWRSTQPLPSSALPPELRRKLQQNTTIVELTDDEFALIKRGRTEETVPPPTLDDLAAKTYLAMAELEEIESLLEEKKQLVFEGPPGSGKTFVAKLFARYFTGNSLDTSRPPDERVELVQFHQTYGYEDFVQGIRPVTDEGGHLQYHVLPGTFMRLCDVAARNPEKRFVLIIDEINRGNLSRIFGELLLLLEYRNERVRLPFGPVDGTTEQAYLVVPDNLYLVGTMNSTDRSLALIDYALRRRFYFYQFRPVEGLRAPILEGWLADQGISEAERQRVCRLFIELNRKVQQELSADFQIGHSYFMMRDIGTVAGLDRVWRRAVRPLLAEYFHNQRDPEAVLTGFEPDKLLAKVGATATEPDQV